MSLALGAVSCVTSGGFLVAAMWRDRIEEHHKRSADERARFAELTRRRQKRLEAPKVEYRPIISKSE